MRFAVIGAGVSGLSAAWLLSQRHDVTLYESDGRLGGHANTVDVETVDGRIAVDTGFIVYNTASYPNLIALFDHIGVATAPTSMGFAVSLNDGAYEYSGSGLGGLFAQPANVASAAHWRMIRDIFRFFRDASDEMATVREEETLRDWLYRKRYSLAFVERHIVPMGAAIWSTPADKMLDFPFAAFARFFSNHGLLQTFNRPEWRTVVGGSRTYVAKLRDALSGQVHTSCAVRRVAGNYNGAVVHTADGQSATYDGVIVATHADDAVAIAPPMREDHGRLLRSFRYEQNDAVLHSDASVMPKRRRAWAAWNYQGASRAGEDRVAVTYWMNKLQPLATAHPLFVSLNPGRQIDVSKRLGTYAYHHPIFDRAALEAQPALWGLQSADRIWYAGSYFGYGFHEDGLQAGLAAAEDMSLKVCGAAGSVKRPWIFDEATSRIPVRPREPALAATELCP